MTTHANINIRDHDTSLTIAMLADGYPEHFVETLSMALRSIDTNDEGIALVDAFFPNGTPIDPRLDREQFPNGLGDCLHRYDIIRDQSGLEIVAFDRHIDPRARPRMQGWDEVFKGTPAEFQEWVASGA